MEIIFVMYLFFADSRIFKPCKRVERDRQKEEGRMESKVPRAKAESGALSVGEAEVERPSLSVALRA